MKNSVCVPADKIINGMLRMVITAKAVAVKKRMVFAVEVCNRESSDSCVPNGKYFHETHIGVHKKRMNY